MIPWPKESAPAEAEAAPEANCAALSTSAVYHFLCVDALIYRANTKAADGATAARRLDAPHSEPKRATEARRGVEAR